MNWVGSITASKLVNETLMKSIGSGSFDEEFFKLDKDLRLPDKLKKTRSEKCDVETFSHLISCIN